MQFSLYKFGGDKEIRTPDPLLARQVLSQLSYTPKIFYDSKIVKYLYYLYFFI